MSSIPPPSISKVVIVGGPSSIVNTMGRHFSGLGVEVIAHLADVANAKGKARHVSKFPPGTEGAVIMVDTTSHSVAESAKSTAKKVGVPYVGIPRKWSKAAPILRSRGFLPPVTDEGGKLPKPGEQEDVALAYVCNERSRGRAPKFEEVQAILQRAYGPKFLLDQGMFADIHSKASARIPILPSQADPKNQEEEEAVIRDWTQTLIVDKPERLLDIKVLNRTVRKDTKTTLGLAQSSAAINEAIDSLKVRFKSLATADLIWREPIMLGWLVRHFERFQARETKYPNKALLEAESRAIFGVSLLYRLVPEARSQAMGEWARDILRHREAFDYYKSKAPESTFEGFKHLMREGKIKNFRSGPLWFTSKIAVDEFLKAADPFDGFLKAADPPAEVEAPAETEPVSITYAKADVAEPDVYKAIAEEVSLEVLSLFEGMVTKRLKPLQDELGELQKEIRGMQASVEQSHKISLERIEAAETVGEALASSFPKFQRDLVTALKEVIKPTIELPKKVNGLFAEIKGLKAEAETITDGLGATARIVKDSHDVIGIRLDALDKLASEGGEMTLRGLGELARDTGLRVIIQTPEPTEG